LRVFFFHDLTKAPIIRIFGSSESVRTCIGGKKIETNVGIIRSFLVRQPTPKNLGEVEGAT